MACVKGLSGLMGSVGSRPEEMDQEKANRVMCRRVSEFSPRLAGSLALFSCPFDIISWELLTLGSDRIVSNLFLQVHVVVVHVVPNGSLRGSIQFIMFWL